MEETIIREQLHISVRALVEFIFREGDIDNRGGKIQSPEAMVMGTRIHRKIQKSQDASYRAEVPLKLTMSGDLYDLTLEGRADGIFTEEKQNWIDEIKGIYRDPARMEEPLFVHLAQARCYAYIYALQQGLSSIGVQITYCNMDTEDIRRFREWHEFPDLEKWFSDLMLEYRKWADFECRWRKIRNASIKALEFPFPYREGQKKLVADVYRTILREKTLFLQAPTGVGKTISTIFPSIKAVGEGLADRIFYLTAKTMTSTAVWNTFALLQDGGYQGKTVQITAKEKMCLCEETECNPVNCPYAKGHFDRINDAIYDLLTRENFFSRDLILAQARKHIVCPFELSLDLSSFSDNIICDYNYAFDPNVYLKRFFGDSVKGNYIFLVDEAHNLVERSRKMYSATLYKEDFLSVKHTLKTLSPKICRYLEKCNRILLEYKRECTTYCICEDIPNLVQALNRCLSELSDFLEKPQDFSGRKEVTDFYFQLRHFQNIYELFDDHYRIYTQLEEDGRFSITLYCVDPSLNLQTCIDRARSTIYFSATLLPVNYYKNLLCTEEEPYAIYARSPFTADQQLVMIGGEVSTRYTRRGPEEYRRMASCINTFLSGKKGNYMVFFPSYRMMQEVFEICRADTRKEGKEICFLLQEAGMSEEDREEFLKKFEDDREETMAAFCVMGGIFSEGIDLTREKLIGAVIVGTGLPQISNEKEILKNYYEEHLGAGFDYAFRYPGMNKVLQSAGRVIRTKEDRGAVLLLDQRFLQEEYQKLLPREWEQVKTVTEKSMPDLLQKFWSGNCADSAGEKQM